MRPERPDDPIRKQVIPTDCEMDAFHGRNGRFAGRGQAFAVPGLVHRYPDRVLMLVTTQCASYCRYCTRARIVGDPTAQFSRHEFDMQIEYLKTYSPGAGCAAFGRRPARAGAENPGRDPHPSARDPAHRNRPHRLTRPGLHAAAHHAGTVRYAAKVPSAVDEHPCQPFERDHQGTGGSLRQADPGRHSARQPVRAAGGCQR